MDGELREECAVAGVYLKRPAPDTPGGAVAGVYTLLAAQTNRGDLSCGIARYNSRSRYLLDLRRGKGKPPELFGKPGSPELKRFLAHYEGAVAIGHNRYATSGDSTDPKEVEYAAQPFLREHDKRCKEFAFCFNGNLPNKEALHSALKGETANYHFKTDTDTELIKIYIARYLRGFNQPLGDKDYVALFSDLAERFDGAYNICFLDSNGRLLAARDPNGFRPLAWAENSRLVACASESTALRGLGLQNVRFLGAGELLLVDETGPRVHRYAESPRLARCVFELIYFMKSGSRFDGISVQRTRERIGTELAVVETLPMGNSTFIAPVPRTGIPIRTGYVNGLLERGMTFRLADALIQEDYDRTFIADFGSQDRIDKIRKKFDMTPGYLEGRDVVLLGDSVVRGHTMRQLVSYIREYGGARSVHLRVGAPPNRYPCFYGINMPTRTDLIAARLEPDEVCRELGLDSLSYLSGRALLRAVGVPAGTAPEKSDFCLGCFTGHYPTDWGNRRLNQIAESE